MMILHGRSDPLVPHNQGELLYMARNTPTWKTVVEFLDTRLKVGESKK